MAMTWQWWIVVGYVLAQVEQSIRHWWHERQQTRASEQACPSCGTPRSKLNGVLFCSRCCLERLDQMM